MAIPLQLIVVWAGLWGGAKLHNDMIFSLFRAPMSFFNATPVGRIINRITRDVTGVDRVRIALVWIMSSS
jgi:ABC-type multidrug transport system fused ATPase/permease subunit